MENRICRKGRPNSHGHSSKGTLPVNLSFLLALLPALAVFCCRKQDPPPPAQKPETAIMLELRLSATSDFDQVDVFIYDDSGLLELEAYGRWSLPSGRESEVCFELRPGDKRAIVIANSPYLFNIGAASNYTAMESFSMPLKDDSPERPLMCGTSQFNTGGNPAEVQLKSHLCRIENGEISSSSGSRLEDLRLSICDYALSVEPLRTSGFFPEECSSDTCGLKGIVWDCRESLGPGEFCGISLYCYPNESESKPSVLKLDYTENGVRKSASKPLWGLKSGEVRLEEWKLR